MKSNFTATERVRHAGLSFDNGAPSLGNDRAQLFSNTSFNVSVEIVHAQAAIRQ